MWIILIHFKLVLMWTQFDVDQFDLDQLDPYQVDQDEVCNVTVTLEYTLFIQSILVVPHIMITKSTDPD